MKKFLIICLILTGCCAKQGIESGFKHLESTEGGFVALTNDNRIFKWTYRSPIIEWDEDKYGNTITRYRDLSSWEELKMEEKLEEEGK